MHTTEPQLTLCPALPLQATELPHPQVSTVHTIDVRSSSIETRDDQCYVRNSSFLSRDIEAQKARADVQRKIDESPKKGVKKVVSPPKRESSRLETMKNGTGQVKVVAGAECARNRNSPSKMQVKQNVKDELSVDTNQASLLTELNDTNITSKDQHKEALMKTVLKSPPQSNVSVCSNVVSPPPMEHASIIQKKNISPPISTTKLTRSESKAEDRPPRLPKRESSFIKEAPIKAEKLSLVATEVGVHVDKSEVLSEINNVESEEPQKSEESNGVGDKIKIFEKAASEASNGGGRVSRSGSIRLRVRSDRSVTEVDEELPPATPFKDNASFELPNQSNTSIDRPPFSIANNSVNTLAARWQRSEVADMERPRPEPQKIIKPEFKTAFSPADVTIRSPSLGAKIPDQFPSHGTAFRNVGVRSDDESTGEHRTCKYRTKERHSTLKGGYYTRGSEEIWMVKKKDIEEIEERVLDSFRRAGQGCSRSETLRVGHEHILNASSRRHAYARSESLEPTSAGVRAHTLKRQSSVACTCGHDRKPRARIPHAEPPSSSRPRSRSHGDDAEQPHVLDKYETLV